MNYAALVEITDRIKAEINRTSERPAGYVPLRLSEAEMLLPILEREMVGWQHIIRRSAQVGRREARPHGKG